MKKHIYFKLLLLLTFPLILGGCGNTKSNNQTMNLFNKQNEKAQQQFGGQNQNVANKVSLYQGTPIISGGLITIPMIIQNDGQNPINFISNNISLNITTTKQIQKKKLFKTETETINKEYTVTNNTPGTYPSNFNLNMGSKDMLQTFITFKLTDGQQKKFSKSELTKAKLVYKTPTGKKETAVKIPSNTTASDMQENLSSIQPTKLGEYYHNIAELMENAAKEDQQESIEAQEAKEQQEQASKSSQSSQSSQSSSMATESSSSIDNPDNLMKNPMTSNARSIMSSEAENDYNDKYYTELHFKISKLNSTHILLDLDNETSEPFLLPLNSFELTSNDQENIMVAANLTNYSIFIPSNKETIVVLPMSQKLNNGDYLPELKDSSDNGKFYSTKHMINQIVYEGED